MPATRFGSFDDSAEFAPNLRLHSAYCSAASSELRRLPIDSADANPLSADSYRVGRQIGRWVRDRPFRMVLHVGKSEKKKHLKNYER